MWCIFLLKSMSKILLHIRYIYLKFIPAILFSHIVRLWIPRGDAMGVTFLFITYQYFFSIWFFQNNRKLKKKEFVTANWKQRWKSNHIYVNCVSVLDARELQNLYDPKNNLNWEDLKVQDVKNNNYNLKIAPLNIIVSFYIR